MSLGPVEYMVIEFPGNQFKGEIIPALREVVDKGVIRIIDLVFVRKDELGNVSVMELSDLQKDAASAFAPLARDTTTLLAEDDIQKVSDIIEKNNSRGTLPVRTPVGEEVPGRCAERPWRGDRWRAHQKREGRRRACMATRGTGSGRWQ